VVGLDDAMLVQTIAVSGSRCLVDQRGAVAKKNRTLAALHSLVADPKTKVGLPSPGGGHDHLVLVALFEALA
jgi:hypothetical protein